MDSLQPDQLRSKLNSERRKRKVLEQQLSVQYRCLELTHKRNSFLEWELKRIKCNPKKKPPPICIRLAKERQMMIAERRLLTLEDIAKYKFTDDELSRYGLKVSSNVACKGDRCRECLGCILEINKKNNHFDVVCLSPDGCLEKTHEGIKQSQNLDGWF